MNFKTEQSLTFTPIQFNSNDHLVNFDLGIVYCVDTDDRRTLWQTRRVEKWEDGRHKIKWQFKHQKSGSWQDKCPEFSDQLENRYKDYVVENHVLGDTDDQDSADERYPQPQCNTDTF